MPALHSSRSYKNCSGHFHGKAPRVRRNRIEKLGDFTADLRLLWLSGISLVIGLICAYIAIALLDLIGFFTNIFFYQKASFAFVSPSHTTLGPWIIVIPVIGGLIVGLMARFGSERIRGHGIPEALEAILFGQSNIEPKVAFLKPISSAICIGSGGPFGAEGPIIMTGGAVGSLIGQMIRLSASERKVLLVAGAAGGMSATFGAPVAAVLLAVELLLFEWKPRSLIPVAVASASAALLRGYILGFQPLFPVAAHPLFSVQALMYVPLVGLVAGVGSFLLTILVYAAEDTFKKLPVHWMWWPAIGGVFIGIGGWIYPPALGVGYDNIRTMLAGNFTIQLLVGILLVKSAIWGISLGSGTSGGVLAPLLMMGAALGGMEAHFIPAGDPSIWALISMAAILGGTMRAPFTGVVFALELTHDMNSLLPLLIACVTAYAFTVLVLKRSILTEKVARRGFHMTREYTVDPLEIVPVKKVMTVDVVAIPASMKISAAYEQFFKAGKHQGYPVVSDDNKLVGLIMYRDLVSSGNGEFCKDGKIEDIMHRDLICTYPDEPLYKAAERMLAADVGRLPVVSRSDVELLVGFLTRSDLLKARLSMIQENERREQIIKILAPTALSLHLRSQVGTREQGSHESLAS